jgi:DNA polymerase-3 subunit alpha
MSKIENVLPIVSNCEDRKIKILPPDINKSDYKYTPEGDCIRFGLGGIEGLGKTVVDEITNKRDPQRPFKSLFDFCTKVNTQKVNKKGMEALIKAGAFDEIL